MPKKESKKQHYHPAKFEPLVKIVAGLIKSEPFLVDDVETLMKKLHAVAPTLADKTRCANCGASMSEYIFEFDSLDAILLLKMATEVRRKQNMEIDFTEANKTRVQQLDTTYAIKSRTTQCSKLGLIAKLKNDEGSHISGTWVITTRGWDALRGKAVQKWVKVFRGEILERSEETITIGEAFLNFKGKKETYQDEMTSYEPSEWVHIAGLHQGELI